MWVFWSRCIEVGSMIMWFEVCKLLGFGFVVVDWEGVVIVFVGMGNMIYVVVKGLFVLMVENVEGEWGIDWVDGMECYSWLLCFVVDIGNRDVICFCFL